MGFTHFIWCMAPRVSRVVAALLCLRLLTGAEAFLASCPAVHYRPTGGLSSRRLFSTLSPSPFNSTLPLPNMTAVSFPQTATTTERKSEALPFLARPSVLDTVDLAGDRGFDPLHIAKTEKMLLSLRKAEVKHARLAMIAALGWLSAELFATRVADSLRLPRLSLEANADGIVMAPTLINGDLQHVNWSFWLFALLLAFHTELLLEELHFNNFEYEPGNFNYDPLGLFPTNEKGQKDMFEKEIKNGRLAMVGMVWFVLYEAIVKSPVAASLAWVLPIGAALPFLLEFVFLLGLVHGLLVYYGAAFQLAMPGIKWQKVDDDLEE